VYKNIRERKAEHGPVEEIKIVLKAARKTNGRRQRQYDLSSANEIAVLMPGDYMTTEPRDITIQAGTGTRRVSMKLMLCTTHCSTSFCISGAKIAGHRRCTT
jgi:hypothetical protein